MIEKIKTINFVIILGIVACYFADYFNPLIFGIYFMLNGLFSIVLLVGNKKPLWIGIGGFEHGMQKLLKSNYNRYMNLTSGLICVVFGYLMLKHYYW